jgi:hypothetical protein
MNLYFVGAAFLSFAVGLVHSVFGEHLIFRRLRAANLVHANGAAILRRSHLRILWATWHLATAFGWGLALALMWMAGTQPRHQAPSALVFGIAGAMAAGALLVLGGTRGRHPGWIALSGVAILTLLGHYA